MSRRAASRRITVVTGSRAEYGLLTSTMRAVQDAGMELRVVVCGMHLLRRFGLTVRDIERDGWPIAARIRLQRGDDDPLDQARGLGEGVRRLARCFEQERPDVVLVLGDRIEALAAALAAVTTGRLLAHIHGGDVAAGDFDDSLRHAITKLAHLHFTASQDARRRVLRLGERAERVAFVGAPGLDRLRELIDIAPAQREDFALVVQHAYGRPARQEERVMRDTLAAVADLGLRRRILFPNTDRGHSGVLRAIERHVRESPPGSCEVAKSLSRDEYLRALLRCRVLVGNSSSGLIEAPFAGTPSVCIGERQSQRLAGGRGVISAEETRGAIRAAISKAASLRLPRGRAGPYGDGRAGRRIAEALRGLPRDVGLTRKLIAY